MSQLSRPVFAESFAADAKPSSFRTREELINDHRGLAISIAHRRCHRLSEREDVEQVAMIALINAADRFDPEREVSFATFAWSTIEGEIKRFFRDYSSAIHIARPLRESSLRVSAAVDELTNVLGRSPTMDELARHTGLSIETVVESLELLRNSRPTSLENMRHDDENGFEVAQCDRELDIADDRQLLLSYTKHLPRREQQILALRFFEQRSQGEIGELLGVSQMHVSRLLNRSLSTLRKLALARQETDVQG